MDKFVTDGDSIVNVSQLLGADRFEDKDLQAKKLVFHLEIQHEGEEPLDKVYPTRKQRDAMFFKIMAAVGLETEIDEYNKPIEDTGSVQGTPTEVTQLHRSGDSDKVGSESSSGVRASDSVPGGVEV